MVILTWNRSIIINFNFTIFILLSDFNFILLLFFGILILFFEGGDLSFYRLNSLLMLKTQLNSTSIPQIITISVLLGHLDGLANTVVDVIQLIYS
jgi:hypothetical protein